MATLRTQPDRFYSWLPFDAEPFEKAGDPIEKAGTQSPLGDEDHGRVSGIITSERRDADDEVVVQSGIDWSFFKSFGKISYGHPARNDNICGEPLDISPTLTDDGVAAMKMRGQLFLWNPLGRKAWETAKGMAKSGARTRLGFSVEGEILERDPSDRKRITKARVLTVAVDPAPRNFDSWLDVMAAGMTAHLARTGHQSLEEWAKAGCPLPQLREESPAADAIAKAAAARAGIDWARLCKGLEPVDVLIARVVRRLPEEFNREAAIQLLRDAQEYR
jgi:hypothetical protein